MSGARWLRILKDIVTLYGSGREGAGKRRKRAGGGYRGKGPKISIKVSRNVWTLQGTNLEHKFLMRKIKSLVVVIEVLFELFQGNTFKS